MGLDSRMEPWGMLGETPEERGRRWQLEHARQMQNMALMQQRNGLSGQQVSQLHALLNQSIGSQPIRQTELRGEFKKETSLMGEIVKDLKQFIKEHNSLIFTIGFALIIDHLVFKGAFKEKLQSMVEKMLDRADAKIGGPSGTV